MYMIWTHMLDPFQSFQVVPKMINSDQTKSFILTCFIQRLISTQRVFTGFFRIAKPTVLRAMLIIIFWKLNIVKTTSKKTRALIYSMKFLCPEAAVNLYVANLSFLFVLNPWFVVKNVIKLVKYALCFKYVEGALTNRLNLFHSFIFADFFPPTARIWNFWLARLIFLTCSWFARVKKSISYLLIL